MQTTGKFAQRIMWVIWPAFLVAGAGTAIFFTMIDPSELTLFGQPVELSRQAIYTVGFFGFWALGVASSALTVFLERSPWEVEPLPDRAERATRGMPEARRRTGPLRAGGRRVEVIRGTAGELRAPRRAAGQARWPMRRFSAIGIEQLDRPALHLDQSFLLEAREEPAHRLELEPEVAADFLARHAQHELGRRVAAQPVAVGEVEQEDREALLGAHAAEQQHDVLVARDLLRQELVEIALQRGDVLRRGARAGRTAARRPRCPRAPAPGSRGGRCRCRPAR